MCSGVVSCLRTGKELNSHYRICFDLPTSEKFIWRLACRYGVSNRNWHTSWALCEKHMFVIPSQFLAPSMYLLPITLRSMYGLFFIFLAYYIPEALIDCPPIVTIRSGQNRIKSQGLENVSEDILCMLSAGVLQSMATTVLEITMLLKVVNKMRSWKEL